MTHDTEKVRQRVTLNVTIELPNEVKLARYARVPELGPRVLFFTGGTALRPLSQRITDYSHNSIHLITPFDSGGSSAEIRKRFSMLAVGDIRNRIMALADSSVQGNHEVVKLFAYRLPKDLEQDELRDMLEAMVADGHPMVQSIPHPMRKIIRNHLGFFSESMPKEFDLRGASIGNLILTGGYVNNRRQIDPVIYLFTMLVKARGQVRAVSNRNCHLVAELEDGTVLVGQHLLTGKETDKISVPVKRVYIAEDKENPEPVELEVRPKISKLIRSADLICYPIGSFYSSVVANLLLKGVGDAIRHINKPKVYIPNLGRDPEALGLSLVELVRTLLGYLRQSCSEPAKDSELLQFILLDSKGGDYPGGAGPEVIKELEDMGLQVIDAPMVSERSAPYLDEELVLQYLLSLT